MSTTRVHHPTTPATDDRGRYLRGLALANRRRGYSYVERPAHVGGPRYRVPSCTVEGVRYKVDVAAGTCECRDAERGHTCKHLVCAMILASRRRATLARMSV